MASHQLELRNVVGVANICYCFLCGYACVRAYTLNGGEIQFPLWCYVLESFLTAGNEVTFLAKNKDCICTAVQLLFRVLKL